MITSVLMFLQFSLSDIEILGLIYLLAVVTYISANRAYELWNHFSLLTLPTNFRILCGHWSFTLSFLSNFANSLLKFILDLFYEFHHDIDTLRDS